MIKKENNNHNNKSPPSSSSLFFLLSFSISFFFFFFSLSFLRVPPTRNGQIAVSAVNRFDRRPGTEPFHHQRLFCFIRKAGVSPPPSSSSLWKPTAGFLLLTRISIFLVHRFFFLNLKFTFSRDCVRTAPVPFEFERLVHLLRIPHIQIQINIKIKRKTMSSLDTWEGYGAVRWENINQLGSRRRRLFTCLS